MTQRKIEANHDSAKRPNASGSAQPRGGAAERAGSRGVQLHCAGSRMFGVAAVMWRTGGSVVQYVYHPDQPTVYGEDFPWDVGGAREFSRHQVEHRIVMNTPGQKNGVVQGWFDSVLALDAKTIRFRDVSAFAIDTFYVSTFFGGSDSSWAPSKDVSMTFDDIIVSKTAISH